MIQHPSHKSSIPQECLRDQVIYAIDVPKLRVSYGFVQRKVRREKGNEDVAEWPVFHICIVWQTELAFFSSRIGDNLGNHLPSSRITLSPNILISTAPFIRSTSLVRISLIGFDLALTSIAHTPNRSDRLPKSVPVEMSDRDALGDGEDALVTTDGDLACRSIENIDANRDLALCASKPSMLRSRAV